ncbi:MAG: macro domain-containing protein [Bacteroidales bacterium]
MKIENVQIEVTTGNIVNQPDIAAIVNAANAQLRTGGGVAGAIHRAAGPGLEKECVQYAPVKPGEAVITKAHDLPNQYVIHCLGPVYGVDHPESLLLANCYRNAIRLAEENKIDSIAFPAISTGAFGYPVEEATDVVVSVIHEVCPGLHYLRKLRFVLFSKSDFAVYQRKLTASAAS